MTNGKRTQCRTKNDCKNKHKIRSEKRKVEKEQEQTQEGTPDKKPLKPSPFRDNPNRLALREAVRFAYDLQKLRIQEGNRAGAQADHAKAALDEKHKAFLERASTALKNVEADAFKEVKRLLKPFPIYTEWLSKQKGVGPQLAGVILAYFDPYVAPTPSSFLSYAGIAVDPETGKADRLRKGHQAHFNPWLKAKLLAVLCGSFVKARSPWACFYYYRKHRRVNQTVDVCMLCKGEKKFRGKTCECCKGTGGPAAWGASDMHRHKDANRYMLKMFLTELWLQWRQMEDLPLRVPYQVEYLGHVHEEVDTPAQMMVWMARRWQAGAFATPEKPPVLSDEEG